MADKKVPQVANVENPKGIDDETAQTQAEETLPADPVEPAGDTTPPAETTDSIDLPEPDRDEAFGDDAPDTATTVAGEDDRIDTDGEDTGGADTPAEDTPPILEKPEEVTREVVVEKRGGFLPLALGGVVAAGLGFAAALGTGGAIPGLGGNADLQAKIEAQEQVIAELRAAIPPAADLAPVTAATETNVAAIAELSDRVEGIALQLVELTDRMAEVEKAPIEGGVSDQAISAYEAELTRLQDAMRQQREEVEGMVAQAEAMKADAAARSSETQARAAVTRVLSALDNGDGFAEALDDLSATGTQIPDALSANAEGVATLSDLRADFPEAARNALAVTRGAGNSSVGDFFRTQLGVRSLNPREGDDPDAVLSRAEAAVAQGDLSTALTEIKALPEPARAELADWTARAETRLAATEAANGLLTELNSN
ncbi:MAG: hypothetical protein VX791_14670 [Pseudomonadota bacterium]|nr:hypothetical protein [Pseudomonadota bacterium]